MIIMLIIVIIERPSFHLPAGLGLQKKKKTFKKRFSFVYRGDVLCVFERKDRSLNVYL